MGERKCRSQHSPAPKMPLGPISNRRAGERPGEEAAVALATTWEAGGGRDLGEICASALSLPGRS